jgi:hypothetical protein
VKRVLVALLVVPLAAAAIFGVLGLVFRRRRSSFPVLASVVSQWLIAYMLWTLAAALAESYGLLERRSHLGYTRSGFGLFAIIFGVWQYRLARAGAGRQASRVFAWSQIGWLLLMLAEHGALG